MGDTRNKVMVKQYILFSILALIISQTTYPAMVSAASPKQSSYPATRWCIATPTLRVRNLPSTDGVIIDKIPYGVQVLVLGEKSEDQTIGKKIGRWVEIQFRGRQGYAFDAFFATKEPTIAVGGLKKKTAALVNSFQKTQDRCEIEFVDATGKAFTEIAGTAEICDDELLGKRVKISYGADGACKKGGSCQQITVHEMIVIPLFSRQ